MADKIKCEYDRLTMDDSGAMLLSFRVLDKQSARQAVDKVKGDEIAITVSKWHNKRSLDANAYFHLLATKIAAELKSTLEEIKHELVLKYGTVMEDESGVMVGFKLLSHINVTKIYKYARCVETKFENGKEFKCYIIYKRTSELESKEMARLIEGAISEAKELDIETMTPQEMERLITAWGSKYDKKE